MVNKRVQIESELNTLINQSEIDRATRAINERNKLVFLKQQRKFMHDCFIELDRKFLAEQVIEENELRMLCQIVKILEGRALEILRDPGVAQTEKAIILYMLYEIYQKGLIEDWAVN